jgi:hypothetical protein
MQDPFSEALEASLAANHTLWTDSAPPINEEDDVDTDPFLDEVLEAMKAMKPRGLEQDFFPFQSREVGLPAGPAHYTCG